MILDLPHTATRPVLTTGAEGKVHVEAALEIGAKEFLTFNGRQRDTARAAGLKVLP